MLPLIILILSFINSYESYDIKRSCNAKIDAIMNHYDMVKYGKNINFFNFDRSEIFPSREIDSKKGNDGFVKAWIDNPVTAMYFINHANGFDKKKDNQPIYCVHQTKCVKPNLLPDILSKDLICDCAFIDLHHDIIHVEATAYDRLNNFIIGVVVFKDDTRRHLVIYDNNLRSNNLNNQLNKTIEKITFLDGTYPAAMTIINDNLYLVWELEGSDKQFYQVMKYDIEKIPLTYDLDKHDMRPVTHWKGCPQDMCLEGNIDWMLKYENAIMISREGYVFTLNEHRGKLILKKDDLKTRSRLEKNYGIIETTYADEDDIIHITATKIILVRSRNIVQSRAYLNIPEGVILAATYNSKDNTTTFFYENGECYVRRSQIVQLYGSWVVRYNLPWEDIDAAYYNSDNYCYYFFKNDFHVVYDTKDDKISKIRPNYGNIWGCNQEDFYLSGLKKWFHFYSYQDYWTAVSKFRIPKLRKKWSPSPNFNYELIETTMTTTTKADSTPVRDVSTADNLPSTTMTPSTKTEDKDGPNIGMIAGIVVGVVAFLVILIAVICLILKKDKSKKRNPSTEIYGKQRYKSHNKSFFETTLHTTIRPENTINNTKSYSSFHG